jgi:hypothetical protein
VAAAVVEASGVAATGVAVEVATAGVVGGAVDAVQPITANMIVPSTSSTARRIERTLAAAGPSRNASTGLRLTVFTSVDCLNSCGYQWVAPQRVFPIGPFEINAMTAMSFVPTLVSA